MFRNNSNAHNCQVGNINLIWMRFSWEMLASLKRRKRVFTALSEHCVLSRMTF